MGPEIILSNWRNTCFDRTRGFTSGDHFFEILVSCTHYNKRRVMAIIWIFLSRYLFILKQSALVVYWCEFLTSLGRDLWLVFSHTVFLAFIVFLDRIEPTFSLSFNDIFNFPIIYRWVIELFWKQLYSNFVTTLFALLLFIIEFALQVGEILEWFNFNHKFFKWRLSLFFWSNFPALQGGNSKVLMRENNFTVCRANRVELRLFKFFLEHKRWPCQLIILAERRFMLCDEHISEIIHTADSLKHLQAVAAADVHTLGHLVVGSCRGSFASKSLWPQAATGGSATATAVVIRFFLTVFKRCCR